MSLLRILCTSSLLVFTFFFSKIGRRSALHVSEGCLALFSVAFGYQKNSVYKNRFNEAILRMQASGLIDKMLEDVKYDAKKFATGRQQIIGKVSAKMNRVANEERALTLADTEGMFIFLAIGFIIAVSALISEWVGGCTNKVLVILKKRKDDRDEADRLEREERDRRPSRKVSIFSRRSGGEKTPHSTTSISSMNNATLKELYEGPETQTSVVCMYNNSLILEENLNEAHRQLQERKEEEEENLRSNPSSAGSIKNDGAREISTTAEVNNQNTQKNIPDEGIFGAEVLH